MGAGDGELSVGDLGPKVGVVSRQVTEAQRSDSEGVPKMGVTGVGQCRVDMWM